MSNESAQKSADDGVTIALEIAEDHLVNAGGELVYWAHDSGPCEEVSLSTSALTLTQGKETPHGSLLNALRQFFSAFRSNFIWS